MSKRESDGKKVGGILDPRFQYRDSKHTDVRKTFDRMYPGWRKKRGNKEKEQKSETVMVVVPLTGKRQKG